uniref:Uncharacterized protein n=1 Tax=uncultured bacterium 5G4 TaxID=1701326 RepID=A0A166H2F8_9BACT|nr:hypothetical protein 5G4_001 [uncultured bacterium 5G4]
MLVLMLLLVNDVRVMGKFVNSRSQNVVAVATTATILILSTAYLGLLLLQFLGLVST